jgi:hypothetical protein
MVGNYDIRLLDGSRCPPGQDTPGQGTYAHTRSAVTFLHFRAAGRACRSPLHCNGSVGAYGGRHSVLAVGTHMRKFLYLVFAATLASIGSATAQNPAQFRIEGELDRKAIRARPLDLLPDDGRWKKNVDSRPRASPMWYPRRDPADDRLDSKDPQFIRLISGRPGGLPDGLNRPVRHEPANARTFWSFRALSTFYSAAIVICSLFNAAARLIRNSKACNRSR